MSKPIKGMESVVSYAQSRLADRLALMKEMGTAVEFEEFGSFWLIDPVPTYYDLNQVNGLADAVHRFAGKDSEVSERPVIRHTNQANYSYYMHGRVYLRTKDRVYSHVETLHELAHHYYSTGHGPAFVKGFNSLLVEFCGSQAASYFTVCLYDEMAAQNVSMS